MTPCAMEWEQFKLSRPVCLSFSECVGEAVVNVSALELLGGPAQVYHACNVCMGA